MLLSRNLISVLALSMMTAVAFAADVSPPPACPPHAARAFMGSLSPEQRMMHFADVQKATAGMSDDQARAWRESQHDKAAAMTDDQRAKDAADLKARWDALSAARKTEIQTSFQERHATGGWGHEHHGDCK